MVARCVVGNGIDYTSGNPYSDDIVARAGTARLSRLLAGPARERDMAGATIDDLARHVLREDGVPADGATVSDGVADPLSADQDASSSRPQGPASKGGWAGALRYRRSHWRSEFGIQ